MVKPPPLRDFVRFPVTTGTIVAAVAGTLWWWSGHNLDALVMNGRVWERWELWRALTCVFPHGDILHLAFNLYWTWALGTILERAYGHLRYLGVVVLLAVGSSLAEFTFLQGGIGLSGVGYGFWGMLWALERRDLRFAGAMDAQTSRLFIAWFFVCIVLTVTHIMPIGNIAHGVGAGLGALLGVAATSWGRVRWGSSLGIAAVVLLGLAGSTVLWPKVNLSSYAEAEVERAGVDALDNRNNTRAVTLLETASRMRHAPARAWYNLGVAYQRVGRRADALAAYEHAAAMPDASTDMVQTATDMKRFLKVRQTTRELLGR